MDDDAAIHTGTTDSGPTGSGPTGSGPTGTGDTGGGGSTAPARRTRRWWIGVVAALVVGAGAGAWVTSRPDTVDEPGFCRRVAELPELSASAAQTGTPADGFAEFAEQLDDLARSVEDDGGDRSAEVAAAARTLAEHQRSMADVLGGSVSADDVVEQVSNIDAAPVEAARTTLAEVIDERCN